MTQRYAAGLAKGLRAVRVRCAHIGPRVPRDGPSPAPIPGTLLQNKSCTCLVCQTTKSTTTKSTPVAKCRARLPFFHRGTIRFLGFFFHPWAKSHFSFFKITCSFHFLALPSIIGFDWFLASRLPCGYRLYCDPTRPSQPPLTRGATASLPAATEFFPLARLSR